MARYQTAILLDNLTKSPVDLKSMVDPYCDPVLNSLNPLPQAAEPSNYDPRARFNDQDCYDQLLKEYLHHFAWYPGCCGYDKLTWEERVPLIGAAYQEKYTDCTCLNTVGLYRILTSPDRLWWLADPVVAYIGPTGK